MSLPHPPSGKNGGAVTVDPLHIVSVPDDSGGVWVVAGGDSGGNNNNITKT